jgi:hypothetical protein
MWGVESEYDQRILYTLYKPLNCITNRRKDNFHLPTPSSMHSTLVIFLWTKKKVGKKRLLEQPFIGVPIATPGGSTGGSVPASSENELNSLLIHTD